MKRQIRTQQVGNGARDCASRTSFPVMLILLVSGPYLRSKRLGDYFWRVLEPSILSSLPGSMTPLELPYLPAGA